MLNVKSALPAGQVALWERHAEHPDGEVFISDDQVYLVAPTATVLSAVSRNVLVIVPSPAKETAPQVDVPPLAEDALPARKPAPKAKETQP